MAHPPLPRDPKHRLHKPSGQAVVTLRGRDVYLGRHGTPGSYAAYDRVVTEWRAAGRPAGPPDHGPLISELVLAYLDFAQEYYVTNTRSNLDKIRSAVRPLLELYAGTPARDFRPLDLQAVRDRLVASGNCRKVINSKIHIIRAMFKWAVSRELLPADSWHALLSVTALRRGRTRAPDHAPVQPVPDEYVEAALRFVSAPVAALIRLQQLTGARAGELLGMRTRDMDTTGRVWLFTPQ